MRPGTTCVIVLACAQLSGAQAGRSRPDIQVAVRGSSLTVHLAAPAPDVEGPLIVYITGDGGWPGDERLFDRMMPWGLPMAGFSAVDYIFPLASKAPRTIEPTVVAADLRKVIDAAIDSLKLPKDRGVVLVGFSRGATLAVAAATDPELRARVKGVVALALAADDEFVASPFQSYAALPSLDPLKVVIIQSTRDEILSAADARRRFGPDTLTRRLRPVDARDHSFGGKIDDLMVEVKASVEWINKQ